MPGTEESSMSAFVVLPCYQSGFFFFLMKCCFSTAAATSEILLASSSCSPSDDRACVLFSLLSIGLCTKKELENGSR